MRNLTPEIDADTGSVFYGGPLSRFVGHLDQALYIASCFCGQRDQIIYVSTDPKDADPQTEEAYRILDADQPAPEGWEPCYRLVRLGQ